ncbi:MAG: hypothetical protein E7016_04850 [Alphaproteobacteria bacterium]|nr:hypothetical protein [Alphaproteobacteria bacterium]
MNRYNSKLRFVRADANLILVKAMVDTTEQVVFECTGYESIHAVYSQKLKYEEGCMYHLLHDEHGQLTPVYQRPGIGHTCSIFLEEKFDSHDIITSECVGGVDGRFNLRSIILERDGIWYHWMGKTLTSMGKRLAKRVFYNEETKELTVFSTYPLVIKDAVGVVATEDSVVYGQNDKMCRKLFRNGAWEDVPS